MQNDCLRAIGVKVSLDVKVVFLAFLYFFFFQALRSATMALNIKRGDLNCFGVVRQSCLS